MLRTAGHQWRVLATAHQKRNYFEYEGVADIDESLVAAIVRVTREAQTRSGARRLTRRTYTLRKRRIR